MFIGKVALVTGGGSGIGRATCQVLAREGAKVVVLEINEGNAKGTIDLLEGSGHSYHVVDVADRRKLESAMSDIIGRYKTPPTIVVNSAGICTMNDLLGMTSEDFDKTHSVNSKGTLNVIQVTCKEMMKHKLPGSIINIGSVAYCQSILPKFAVYAMTKAGVHVLTKSVASEMGKYGIRCNVIHPGMIETPLCFDNTTEEFRKEFSSKTALGRAGQAKEVGEVVAFLASDKSSYVTGASIEVSGGL